LTAQGPGKAQRHAKPSRLGARRCGDARLFSATAPGEGAAVLLARPGDRLAAVLALIAELVAAKPVLSRLCHRHMKPDAAVLQVNFRRSMPLSTTFSSSPMP